MPCNIDQLLQCSITPNLKYLNTYLKLIELRQHQTTQSTYHENHHILPKSFGGSNSKDNLVMLTAREHFIAHLLLAKGTGHPKMMKALHKMTYSRTVTQQREYRVTSHIYEYVRKQSAKIVSDYSKRTVTAYDIELQKCWRVPVDLFNQHKNSRFLAVRKGIPRDPEAINQSVETRVPVQILVNGVERTHVPMRYVRSIFYGTFSIKHVTARMINGFSRILGCDVSPNISAVELTELMCASMMISVKSGYTTDDVTAYFYRRQNFKNGAVRAKSSREARTKMIFVTPTGTYYSFKDLVAVYPWMTHTIKATVAKPNSKVSRNIKNIDPAWIGQQWQELGFVFSHKP